MGILESLRTKFNRLREGTRPNEKKDQYLSFAWGSFGEQISKRKVVNRTYRIVKCKTESQNQGKWI